MPSSLVVLRCANSSAVCRHKLRPDHTHLICLGENPAYTFSTFPLPHHHRQQHWQYLHHAGRQVGGTLQDTRGVLHPGWRAVQRLHPRGEEVPTSLSVLCSPQVQPTGSGSIQSRQVPTRSINCCLYNIIFAKFNCNHCTEILVVLAIWNFHTRRWSFSMLFCLKAD